MWKELSGFYNLGLPLFEDQLACGTQRHLLWSWGPVWSCIIWLLKMKDSSTLMSGSIMVVKMCNLIVARLLDHLQNLLMLTKGLETRKHIFNWKKTSSSTYGTIIRIYISYILHFHLIVKIILCYQSTVMNNIFLKCVISTLSMLCVTCKFCVLSVNRHPTLFGEVIWNHSWRRLTRLRMTIGQDQTTDPDHPQVIDQRSTNLGDVPAASSWRPPGRCWWSTARY